MNRRKFINNSFLAVSGTFFLFHFDEKKLYPFLRLSDSENPELKKYLVFEHSKSQISESTIDKSEDAINSMFWITLDPSGNLSSSEKRKALESQRVEITDVYKACNFKYNTIEDHVASAFDWSVGLGGLALGIAIPSTVPVAIGLFSLEKTITGSLEYGLEQKKESQFFLCQKTVERFYLKEGNLERFLSKDKIEQKTQLPFSNSNDELISKLPEGSYQKELAKRVNHSPINTGEESISELLKDEFENQKEQLAWYLEFVEGLQNEIEERNFSELLNFQNEERQAQI